MLLRSYARRVQAICGQLEALNRSITKDEKEINQLVRQHADYHVVSSLTGASTNTHARILAALGDDRQRYATAVSLQTAAGIAPLTIQSGKHKHVSSRWACTKFMKQTFHEYAGLSITKSWWARAFYQLQISKGKTTQMARLALAYKWIRIIHRCWQNREPYDEARYIERLIATNSPLVPLLQANS